MAEKPTPKIPVPKPQPQPRPQKPEVRSYGNGGKIRMPSNKSAGPSGSPKK